MKNLLVICLLALAVPALASPFFPLVPGAIWTLADDDPAAQTTLTMAGPVAFHGATCHPRYESIDGELVGITFWSVDAEERLLLHGLEFLQGAGAEFYFDPPAIFLDPALACDEAVARDVNVYQVMQTGHEWQGEFELRTTCIARDPVTTPLGTFAAITVDPVWTDSPLEAPWRYGHDGLFSYGFGVGPVLITSLASGAELLLVDLQNLVITAAPTPTPSPLALDAAPNPFNPATTLSFALPADGPARLEIHDLAGRRLAILHDGPLAAGPHTFAWQPRGLASGVYLARLSSAAGTATVRVTLVE
jgi:hypothetical protein